METWAFNIAELSVQCSGYYPLSVQYNMRNNDRVQATALRKQGLSYNDIHKKLGVPKSTPSYWFRDLPESIKVKRSNTSSAKKIWANNIVAFNKKRSEESNQKRLAAQARYSQRIGKLTKRELLIMGAALYWAEGYKKSKWNLVFCNSDPDMVLLMMQFFRQICVVEEEKFRPQVQVHANVSSDKAELYWSKIANLPRKQFMKPVAQAPKSSKSRRGNTLPYGTFRLRINDVNQVNRIMGWIAGLKSCAQSGK